MLLIPKTAFRRWILFVLLALPLLYLCLATAIVLAGLKDDARQSDVAVVLGSKVMENGQPSARLAARLDKALELHSGGMVGHVIVSGGTGKEGFSESAVMGEYLVRRGVPTTHIILDDGGATAWLTAQNSAKIMREKGFISAIVVTQYFHIPRTRLALAAHGVTSVRSAHADVFEWRDIYSTFREVPALGEYWVRSFDMGQH